MAREIKTVSGQAVTVSPAVWPEGQVVVRRANTLDDREQEVLILAPLDALSLAIELVEVTRAALERE